MLGQETHLPFSAQATFPTVQELQDKHREHVSSSVSLARIYAQRRLGATGAFYHVKGKHLLPADSVWQAYVPDTEALVIFKPLQNNPPPSRLPRS